MHSISTPLCFILPSMVSLQATFPFETKNLASKKRKSRDGAKSEGDLVTDDHIDLNLDAPLPLEWQRCLDIHSGQIHFYNTRTHRRISREPKLTLEPPSSPLSLDLELNIAHKRPTNHAIDGMSPDAIGIEEMVATVCNRCHMLVVMSKANLSCPNCKFVHPSDHIFSSLIKPKLKLLQGLSD